MQFVMNISGTVVGTCFEDIDHSRQNRFVISENGIPKFIVIADDSLRENEVLRNFKTYLCEGDQNFTITEIVRTFYGMIKESNENY